MPLHMFASGENRNGWIVVENSFRPSSAGNQRAEGQHDGRAATWRTKLMITILGSRRKLAAPNLPLPRERAANAPALAARSLYYTLVDSG